MNTDPITSMRRKRDKAIERLRMSNPGNGDTDNLKKFIEERAKAFGIELPQEVSPDDDTKLIEKVS